MRLSIGQKCTLVVLVLFGLHLSAFVLTQIELASYRDNTLRLANESLPQVRAISELRVAASDLTQQVSDYLLTRDSARTTGIELSIATARKQLQLLRATAPRLNQEAAGEPASFDRVEADLEQLIATARSAIAGASPRKEAQIEQLARQKRELDAGLGPLETIIDRDQRETSAAAQGNPLIIPAVLTGLVALVVGGVLWGVQRLVVRPVQRLTQASIAMAQGNTRQAVEVRTGDELELLGTSFNTMLAALDVQQDQLRERAATLETANHAQAQLLDTVKALAVPTIPLGNGVLLLPLIGFVDAERERTVIDTLLQAVAAQRTRAVIIDCTGLAVPDARTAAFLVELAQSVRLLGGRTICTGIRHQLAATLSAAAIDLSMLETSSTVGEGALAAHAMSG